MTEAQRHQILLEMLAQLGFVTVEKVVERLGISPATARRDINKPVSYTHLTNKSHLSLKRTNSLI